VLIFSVVVHIVAALIAAAYIVVKWIAPPEATFVAKKVIALPPQIIDPRMASAELEAAAPKPVLDEKIASIRETDLSLPDIPQIQTDQVAEFDPSAFITDAAVGLGVGAGGGGGGGAGGGGEGSGLNFFGIQTQAKSVIIIFDISQSVLTKAQKAGVPITAIREETLKLIDALSINTKFNLVQFSRIYQPMAPEMQPPNDAAKAAAKDWLERQFRTDGMLPRSVRGAVVPRAGEDNGITFVLRGVLAMQPDTVFLISDASFQSERHSSQVPWKEVEEVIKAHEKSGGQTKIHVIGFEMKPDDKKEIRSIVRRTGGTVREIGKD
jgi:hypothetical protein